MVLSQHSSGDLYLNSCDLLPPASPHVQGLMHMARTEGMRGMMKGNWTNCVRIIPNSAMKFFTYEQLSRWVYR
jgi:hypothetical protein